MADYTPVEREGAFDFMAEHSGFGEMRSYTEALGTEQMAFTWRQMPAGTGGRGSYGHKHKTQEEVYFIVSGTVTFKVGDDVFEAGPQTAVRVAPGEVRSVHNDTEAEAELVICSPRVDDVRAEAVMEEGFWPE